MTDTNKPAAGELMTEREAAGRDNVCGYFLSFGGYGPRLICGRPSTTMVEEQGRKCPSCDEHAGWFDAEQRAQRACEEAKADDR